jgi:hypothetical protein
MATPNDIQQIINMFLAAFPNYKPTDMTPEIFFQTLQDIPSEELKVAVLNCLTEAGRAFAPSIGEIRGAVANLRRTAANVPSSYEAWQEVLTQMSINGGDYGTPVWSHPLVERVVRQLGWRNLRMSEDQTADRARFVQAYDQLLNRAMSEETMLPEVKGYIQSQGGQLLDAPSQVKQLSSRLSK